LELHGGTLFAAEDYHVGTFDTDGAGPCSQGKVEGLAMKEWQGRG
jgi:hypothetical protein